MPNAPCSRMRGRATCASCATCCSARRLLARGDAIEAADLGLPRDAAIAAHATADEPDRASIEAALERAGGVLAQAASELGLSRQALYRRLDRLGIKRD